MIIPTKAKLAIAISAAIALSGCGSSSSSSGSAPSKAFDCTDVATAGSRVICIGSADDLTDETVADELTTALSLAQTGDTIVLPQGRYNISSQMTFDADTSLGQVAKVEDFTIKGAGLELTQLNFEASVSGTDGFSIKNAQDLHLEDFSVYEAPKNAILIEETDGIVIRRVGTIWEEDYSEDNGAYGLYPVECSNILIEDSVVIGSADAGVYVGQSSNIVVRNNIAEKNVAGIEIENSTNADVYGNIARDNTGGILVFDLPIGNGFYGSGVRVFDNEVIENNAPNFAKVGSNPGGVHIVPPGTGIIILSTSDVEIYENTITDHATTAIAITSFLLPDASVAASPNTDVGGVATTDTADDVFSYGDIAPYADIFLDGWSPLVRGINIHDNDISNANGVYNPAGSLIEDLITGYSAAGVEIPDILYDGIGELLAEIERLPDALGGDSSLTDLAGGINLVAQGVHANILVPAIDPDPALLQIDLAEFGVYADADRVCESNNGATTTAGSVYPTNENILPFDSDGNPVPVFEASNDAMTCGAGITPFTGTAAVATIGGVAYGCGSDDTSCD